MSAIRIRHVVAATALLVAPALADAARPVILADTDRNGVIDLRDRGGRGTWTSERGAIFLPNIDDDTGRCRPLALRANLFDGGWEVDRRLEACNDAGDERVNGAVDLRDLAPLRVLPLRGLPTGATARLAVTGPGAANARVFVHQGGTWRPATRLVLTRADLVRGVQAAIEGRGLALTRAAAFVDVRVTVSAGAHRTTDRVRLRLASLRLQNDLMPATRLFTARPPAASAEIMAVPATTSPSLTHIPTVDTSGAIEPSLLKKAELGEKRGQLDFVAALRTATADLSPPVPLRPVDARSDTWIQDLFEAGWVTMPGPGGRPQTMRIVLRAPFGELSSGALDDGSSRPSTRMVYRELRGRDVGVTISRPLAKRPATHLPTLDSTGNLEGLPPSPAHPLGAMLVGTSPTHRIDPAFLRLLVAQADQPVIRIDTTWLTVAHVDELVHVIPSSTPRRWTLAVADPRLALELLRTAQRAGQGGQTLADPRPGSPGRTVDAELADPKVIADNEQASVNIDRQIATLSATLEIPADEFVRLPVLMRRETTQDGRGSTMSAARPNVVNGLSVRPDLFLAPAPHGPVVDGVDMFAKAVTDALGRQGMTVRFVEDRVFLSARGGEVHCGTNALRRLPG